MCVQYEWPGGLSPPSPLAGLCNALYPLASALPAPDACLQFQEKQHLKANPTTFMQTLFLFPSCYLLLFQKKVNKRNWKLLENGGFLDKIRFWHIRAFLGWLILRILLTELRDRTLTFGLKRRYTWWTHKQPEYGKRTSHFVKADRESIYLLETWQ